MCVRSRDWCAANGQSAFAETVDRQSGHASPDDKGLLTSSPHRDRIPYGFRNLRDNQFTPSLTVTAAGQPAVRSPARIHLAPGQWATLAYTVPSADRTRSLTVEAYDYDSDRWRRCGSVTWTRALAAAVAGSAVETSGSRVRFPAGACPGAGARMLTVTATWTISFNALAGDGYDQTYTSNTTSRWPIHCRPATAVANICDTLGPEGKAALAVGTGPLGLVTVSG